MINYGRVGGQLLKITRRVNSSNYHEQLKQSGFTSICLRLQSTKSNDPEKPTDKEIKDDRSKNKFYKKVPPLPPLPPSYQTNASTPSSEASQQKPLCADHTQCPPTCPVYEECMKANESKGGIPNYYYWKQILAMLILTGMSLYVFRDSFSEIKKSTSSTKRSSSKKRGKKVPIRSPPDSSTIPSEVPYLLIGGGAAAFSAFRSIKANDPKAKVLVVSNEPEIPYMRPPISKELWYNDKDQVSPENLQFKQWNGTQRSLFYEPPEFYLDVNELMKSEKGGVAISKGWSVKKIDPVNQIAYLDDGHEIKYDKCLIATGASPKNLSIFENANEEVLEKVILYRTKEDYLRLFDNIQRSDVKDVVIIGGGFLGSELACSLARNLSSDKKNVYQIFKEKSILAQVLPEYLSEWTTLRAKLEGVKMISNAEVVGYEIKNGRLSMKLSNGQNIEADQVVVAVGVKPNTDFAKESGLEIDPQNGGLVVNAELEARSNLWAAGDVACFYDIKYGRRRIEHYDHAVISGRLAGENMAGAKKPYLHQSMFWTDLGLEIGFEAIGIIDSKLETVGVFAKAEEKEKSAENATAEQNIEKSTENKKTTNEEETTNVLKEKYTISMESTKNSETGEPISRTSEDFMKGVVFYLRNNDVVGVTLWNIYNRISVARQVLIRGATRDEINEVSKLFLIHED